MYTEGPWEIRKWDGDEWPVKRISVGSKSYAVAMCPRYETEETMSNMRLIAAAPELLEALELAAGELRRVEQYNPFHPEEIMREIDSVIAKAKGLEWKSTT